LPTLQNEIINALNQTNIPRNNWFFLLLSPL
jgi:hypothetical protein